MATTSDSDGESNGPVIDSAPEPDPAQYQIERRAFLVATAGTVVEFDNVDEPRFTIEPGATEGDELTVGYTDTTSGGVRPPRRRDGRNGRAGDSVESGLFRHIGQVDDMDR